MEEENTDEQSGIDKFGGRGDTQHPKDTGKMLNAMLDIMSESLARGEKIRLTGFGCFDAKEQAARIARDPRNGKKVRVVACKVPVFKPGKQLKEHINSNRMIYLILWFDDLSGVCRKLSPLL